MGGGMMASSMMGGGMMGLPGGQFAMGGGGGSGETAHAGMPCVAQPTGTSLHAQSAALLLRSMHVKHQAQLAARQAGVCYSNANALLCSLLQAWCRALAGRAASCQHLRLGPWACRWPVAVATAPELAAA